MQTQLSRTSAQASSTPTHERHCYHGGKGQQPSRANSLPSPQSQKGRQYWAASCYGNLDGQLQVRWASLGAHARGGKA